MKSPDPANDSPDPRRGAPVGLDSDRGGDASAGDNPSKATKFVFASGSRPLDGYTIKRGVGRGGFGEVYFATSDAGKEVALKLIRRNLDVELRGVRQCLNLKHPNLVALYDLRTDDAGDQWVVMEYVPLGAGGGQSLEEAIDAHPNGMPEGELLHWFKGIAAGVGYLHTSGIVHRDLKPGNIFRDVTSTSLNPDDGPVGDVKIGDYGLSKFISCSRRSGQTESVGTVHYMAPEIANGRYGREVDLYALGIILYEMLTGHVPFEGESIGEVLMKHLTAEPDLNVLKRPYRDIVRRLLAKDPEERIANVQEMIDLLPGERTVAGPQAPVSGEFPAYDPADVEPTIDKVGPESEPPASNSPSNGSPYVRARVASPWVQERQQAADAGHGEEPLWRGIKDLFRGATNWWANGNAPPLVRGLVLFAVIVLALTTGILGTVIGLLPILLVAYLIYYVVWSIFAPKTPAPADSPKRPPPSDSDPPVAAMAAAQTPGRGHAQQARRLRQTWRETAREKLRAKSFRQNVQELLASMLTSAGICFLLAGIASMFANERFDFETMPWFAWLLITTTLGSWAVLLTNKLTEGRVEDRVPMRGLLLVLGALVGLIAGGMSAGLPAGLPMVNDFGPDANDSIAHELLNFPSRYPAEWNDGVLVTTGMGIAYFATLFALVRWWRLAEWTRDKRLSLWSVAACVFGAWLVHVFWWFPQPTGMLVAGIVAVAVQLASPWLPPSKREAMARGEVA